MVQGRWFSIFMVLVLSGTGLTSTVSADTFRYRYQAGQQYRIISEVSQEVLINGRLDHTANQLNRILVNVQKVDGNKAWHTVDYQNSLESKRTGEVYQYDRTYQSAFWRDELGIYTIDSKFFVPTVRNVPVFPTQDLKPGDTWSAKGSEVHDLRQGFKVPDAFEFPIPVSYKYEGKAKWQAVEYDLISIDYNIFYMSRKTWPGAIWPTQINGYSHQRLYWDNVAGRAVYYDEEYLIQMSLSNKDVVTYQGTADAHVEDIVAFDTKAAVVSVQKQIAAMDIPDVSVREDDKGITLAIENIQFAPDSAVLLPSEKAKIDQLAKILAQYPDRDLMVTGHTAQAGYAPGRQKLSEDRAKSVGQYLIDKQVRDPARLMFQGMGDRQAIADNDSDAGRSRNRRVEITILTK